MSPQRRTWIDAVRDGVALIARADEFRYELQAATQSPQQAQELINMAVELAKMGASVEDLQPLMQMRQMQRMYDLRPEDLRAIGQVAMRHTIRNGGTNE